MRARLLLSTLAVMGAVVGSLLSAPAAASAAGGEFTVSVTTTLPAAPGGATTVPNVVGKDGKAATKALKSADLKWKWSKTVLIASNWTVTKTSPKAGATIKAGGTVKLTVKKRSAVKPTPTPTPSATESPAAPAPAAPAAPAPAAPAPAAPAPVAPAPDVFYQNCDAVRAAGKAPLYAGQPGYSTKLDRDRDGVACE